MNRLCIAIVLQLLLSPAHAVPLTFFGEDLNTETQPPLQAWPNALAAHDDFTAHLTGYQVQDFESLNFPLTGQPESIGLGTVRPLWEGRPFYSIQPSNPDTGQIAISGSQTLHTTGGFIIDFAVPTSAVGFYTSDLGDLGSQLMLTLVTESGFVTTLFFANSGSPALADWPDHISGTIHFFGHIDTDHQFTRAMIDTTNQGEDYFSLDDLTVGTAVPDTLGAGAVFGTLLGLSGTAFFRKAKPHPQMP